MGLNRKPQLGLLLLSILLTLLSSSSSSSSSDSVSEEPPTVYEILPKFGLPSGLLPDSVKSYTLDDDGDGDGGKFEVQLEKPCYVQFEYLVYYEQKITGKLSIGSITELRGIQVQKFFFWFDVDEIRVDLPPSDSIYFLVGFINKKLDVDQFQTVHSCQDNSLALCPRPRPSHVFQLAAATDDVPMAYYY